MIPVYMEVLRKSRKTSGGTTDYSTEVRTRPLPTDVRLDVKCLNLSAVATANSWVSTYVMDLWTYESTVRALLRLQQMFLQYRLPYDDGLHLTLLPSNYLRVLQTDWGLKSTRDLPPQISTSSKKSIQQLILFSFFLYSFLLPTVFYENLHSY